MGDMVLDQVLRGGLRTLGRACARAVGWRWGKAVFLVVSGLGSGFGLAWLGGICCSRVKLSLVPYSALQDSIWSISFCYVPSDRPPPTRFGAGEDARLCRISFRGQWGLRDFGGCFTEILQSLSSWCASLFRFALQSCRQFLSASQKAPYISPKSLRRMRVVMMVTVLVTLLRKLKTITNFRFASDEKMK